MQHLADAEVATLDARFANIYTADGVSLAVEFDDGVLDAPATARALGMAAPHDVDALLQQGLAAQVRAVIDAANERRNKAAHVRSDAIRFAPLVTRPEKIICVGFNYRKHAEETGTLIPKQPPLFSKFITHSIITMERSRYQRVLTTASTLRRIADEPFAG